MTINTPYLCIKTLFFGKLSDRGTTAFVKGETYYGHVDLLIQGGIELIDDTNSKHTITAGLFPAIFKECK